MAVLYDRYSSIVYSVALRVLTDTVAAEESLRTCSMQLWGNPGSFDSSRGKPGSMAGRDQPQSRGLMALRSGVPRATLRSGGVDHS